jgi:hypothetical protein
MTTITNEADFVNFGEISHARLGQQTQYASRFIDGTMGLPRLGDGLRFIMSSNYHAIKIHKDDIEEFVERVLAYRGF